MKLYTNNEEINIKKKKNYRESFRLWGIKALQISLAIMKKPVTGTFGTLVVAIENFVVS